MDAEQTPADGVQEAEATTSNEGAVGDIVKGCTGCTGALIGLLLCGAVIVLIVRGEWEDYQQRIGESGVELVPSTDVDQPTVIHGGPKDFRASIAEHLQGVFTLEEETAKLARYQWQTSGSSSFATLWDDGHDDTINQVMVVATMPPGTMMPRSSDPWSSPTRSSASPAGKRWTDRCSPSG